MPPELAMTFGFVLATVFELTAIIVALRRVLFGKTGGRPVERAIAIAMALLCGGLLGYQWSRGGLMPLQNHAEGLLLLIGLLSGVMIYIQWTGRLGGLELFIGPIATLLTLWGICASWWSFKPFSMQSVWTVVHIINVYIGLLAVAMAAAAGALYLYVQRQLRRTDHPAQRLRRLGRMASLERIEKTVVTAASVGFVLLTLAMITGLLTEMNQAHTALGEHWWASPKVILAAVAWGIYAVVVHVRFAPTFRGSRAAMLSIVGFVVLLVALALALAASR